MDKKLTGTAILKDLESDDGQEAENQNDENDPIEFDNLEEQFSSQMKNMGCVIKNAGESSRNS